MSWHYRLTAFASAAAVAGLMSGAAIAPASAEEIVLKMAVPDWPPTRIMKDLFDKNYKAPSGNDIKLDIDFIPWPDYYTRLNASLTSGEQKYNMAVSDSQWLGAFIEGGYYRQINDLVEADPDRPYLPRRAADGDGSGPRRTGSEARGEIQRSVSCRARLR
jgi:multiple sugar transport system substrate-binding protein